MPRLPSVLLACSFASALTGGESADRVLVVLRATARAQGAFVRLAEVADLPSGPARLRERLGFLLLGFSPAAGALREIDSEEVAARLRESGLPEERFLVKGAARVAVFTGQDPSPPQGQSPPEGPARPRERGRGEAGATPRPPGGSPRGSSPEAGRGQAAGEKEKVIEKGDTVTIRMQGQALVVEEPGRALQSGSAGELLEVQNLRTQKKLVARVQGPGVVVPQDRGAPAPHGE